MKPLEYKTLNNPTTSSTLYRTPHPKNKENKHTNLISSRQDDHLTQPGPSDKNKTEQLSTNLPYKNLTQTTAPTFSSVQSRSRIQLLVTCFAARQASLSITNSWSPPKPMSIESVMPSNHLILCRPLLLQPPIFPSIRVFSNESALRMRWPKYWGSSFSISPSNNTQD